MAIQQSVRVALQKNDCAWSGKRVSCKLSPGVWLLTPHARTTARRDCTDALGVVRRGSFSESVCCVLCPDNRIRDEAGQLLRLSLPNAQRAMITRAAHAFEWQMSVRHFEAHSSGTLARLCGYRETGAPQKAIVLRDEVAPRALAWLLPHANVAGGGSRLHGASEPSERESPESKS